LFLFSIYETKKEENLENTSQKEQIIKRKETTYFRVKKKNNKKLNQKIGVIKSRELQKK
jgi:hypothetical protein